MNDTATTLDHVTVHGMQFGAARFKQGRCR
jgi:hypothetical protein